MTRRDFVRLALALVCASPLATRLVAAQAATVKDPVCGMKIDPAKARGKAEHKGKTYYFCSADCKARFEKNPAKYAEKESAPK